jgi:hypothetical protein
LDPLSGFVSGLVRGPDRTYAGAGAAGNTYILIDHIYSVALGYTGNGTFTLARTATDAGVVDLIGHSDPPSFVIRVKTQKYYITARRIWQEDFIFVSGETHPIFPIKTLIKTDTKANIKYRKQSMDTEQLRM